MRQLLAAAFLLGGCATLYGQTDDFREARLGRGCASVADCRALVQAAEVRRAGCKDNQLGVIRCEDATADLEAAERMLAPFVEEERRERETRHRTEIEAARERQRTEEVEARAAREQAAADRRALAAWATAQAATCGRTLESSGCDRDLPAGADETTADTCRQRCAPEIRRGAERLLTVAVEACVGRYVDAGGKAQATCALEPPEGASDAVRAELAQLVPTCLLRCGSRARQALDSARPVVRTSAPAGGGSQNVMCCDGTRSPTCGCNRSSMQGCCSHHGGICGGC